MLDDAETAEQFVWITAQIKNVKRRIEKNEWAIGLSILISGVLYFFGFKVLLKELWELGLPMIFGIIFVFNYLIAIIELRHFEQQMFIHRSVCRLESLIERSK